MPIVTPTFFECFAETLPEKGHNFQSETFKWILTNTVPNYTTNTVKSDITQIASGNGYTTDGNTSTGVTSTQTAGVYSLTISSPASWIGAGAGMATFRYAVLYNATSVASDLVLSLDYGSSVTVAAGQIFAIDCSSVLFTLTLP